MRLSKSLVQPCLALTILSFTACKTSGSSRVLSTESTTIDPSRSSSKSSLVESEFVIPKEKFSEKVRQIIVTRRAAAVNVAIKGQTTACARTESLLNRVVTRLVAGSSLKIASEQTPPMLVGLACQSRDLRLPETTGGVILIYPEILRGLNTEDQLAALIAHEMIHYLRSHEEDIETTLDTWMPFRENAVNRAKWENEKEADRLGAKLLANAGFDPFAATEVPGLVDQQLVNNAQWKAGQINFPIDSAEERRMRVQFEIKTKKLRGSPQTPGDMASIKDELAQRP
jgi:predicted Zn-dependent protease